MRHLGFDIGTTETGENLLTSLSFLARALGLEIVAEGVETEDQVELLTKLSFDLLQGYFFSKPISADELSTLFEEGANWAPHFRKSDAA